MTIAKRRLNELLYEALETEQGGIQIYGTAIRCARNADLKKEWTKYLAQTRRHEKAVLRVLGALGLDPLKETHGRKTVRGIGGALVLAMESARAAGDADAAEIVAAECVVLAETKDHLNWKLLEECAKRMKGVDRAAIQTAVEEVEDEEDEHLYHSTGWTRELWLDSLGARAVLPPPEEVREVKTAIGAARAALDRTSMRSRTKKPTKK